MHRACHRHTELSCSGPRARPARRPARNARAVRTSPQPSCEMTTTGSTSRRPTRWSRQRMTAISIIVSASHCLLHPSGIQHPQSHEDGQHSYAAGFNPPKHSSFPWTAKGCLREFTTVLERRRSVPCLVCRSHLVSGLRTALRFANCQLKGFLVGAGVICVTETAPSS